MDGFNTRVRHIAQLLSFEQDVSKYDSLEVAAAKLYLKYREEDIPARKLELPDSI
jgi:hypothetical protein